MKSGIRSGFHNIILSFMYFRTQSITRSITGSVAPSPFMVRYDTLDQQEIKDLLICFLYTVKNLSEGEYTCMLYEW